MPTSSRKGRLDDEQTQWSDVCDFIETEKTNARREKLQGDDDCRACTTVSGESDAFQKLKSIVRMKGHDPTCKSICLVEQGCVYLSKIVPWLENMLFDKNIDVYRIKGYFAVGAEQDLIVPHETNQELSYQVEQSYVGNYYCEGSRVTGLKIYPVNMKEKVKSVGSANNLGSLSVTNFGGLYATVSSKEDVFGTKIFIFGKGIDEGVVSSKFFEMMVPQGYIPVCDLKMDFPPFVAEYFKSNSDEKKDFFDNAKEENWRAAYRVSMGKKEDDVCIFFVRGRLYALQAACPHLGGALDQGDIEDFANAGSTDTEEPWPMVSCPQHLFSFDLKTGRGLTSKYNCNTYKIRLVGTTIYLHHEQK